MTNNFVGGKKHCGVEANVELTVKLQQPNVLNVKKSILDLRKGAFTIDRFLRLGKRKTYGLHGNCYFWF